MNRHEYEHQKLFDRHPFTVQQFSEEVSAILAKQIVQKGTSEMFNGSFGSSIRRKSAIAGTSAIRIEVFLQHY